MASSVERVRQAVQPAAVDQAGGANVGNPRHPLKPNSWLDQRKAEGSVSPKLMLAIGHLNLAIAKANGEDVQSPYKCPQTLSELWQGKTWLKDAQGAALGPEGVFQAITGLIDLGIDTDRVITVQDEAEVCNALGKFLRMELAKNEVDWMGELFELRDSYGITCLEDLLMRSKTPTPGTTLIEELPKMAELVGVSEEEIWAVAIAPHLERL